MGALPKEKIMKTLLTLLLMLSFATVQGAYTVRNGKLVNTKTIATQPAPDHYNDAVTAHEAGNWKEAARQFRIVAENFPAHELCSDATFFLGVAEYKAGELDFANEAFNQYIKNKGSSKHFQEAVQYKLQIADDLAGGARRRMFATKQLPKWAPGKDLSAQIYDEVIAAVPSNDLAAKALYAKGQMQWDQGEYKSSITAFQMLTKRFPKHELAPEAYVAISQVYVDESGDEFHNPDALAFAQINLRRFKQDFPKEKRIAQVEQDIVAIQENFANVLYKQGQFYERTNRSKAAAIYYQKAISQFPNTKKADECRVRLTQIDPKDT